MMTNDTPPYFPQSVLIMI